MGLSRTILAAGLLALTAACLGEEADKAVLVTTHGSQTGSSTTGGATVVGVGNALTLEGGAWVFDEPESFEGRVPTMSLVAIGDAMFRAGSGARIVDALSTERGTVALIRGADGRLLLHHFEGEDPAWSMAPSGARRILAGTNDPFTVRLLVDDDVTVVATRIGE